MPRVKFIYVGDGKWIEPTARIGECPHPREHLRFDSRFAAPIYVYCTACGQPYLNPYHGLTDEEIAEAERRGHELWLALNPEEAA